MKRISYLIFVCIGALCALIGLSAPLMAATYTLQSTNFEFSDAFVERESGYDYKVTTVEEDGLFIGRFQFDGPALHAFLAQPQDQQVSVALQMRVYDGDTGTSASDIDQGQLTAAFGSPFIVAPELLLAGFDDKQDVTGSVDALLGNDTALALNAVLPGGAGWLDFWIYDNDEGGNNLYFDAEWEADFQLSLTTTANPVPVPASFLLLTSGFGAVVLLGRRRQAR